MSTLTQCSICKKRPMNPVERKGGTFFMCSKCDAPGPRLPPPAAQPEEEPT